MFALLDSAARLLTHIEDADRGALLRGDEEWRTTERSKLVAGTLKRSKG